MKIFVAYFKRTFSYPMVYFSILCVSIICIIGMSSQSYQFGIINPFNFMLDISSYRKLIMLFASLPFVSCFSQEWNYNLTNQIISRSYPSKYISIHIIMSFFTAFLVTFLGITMCILCLCLKYPLYIDTGNSNLGAFLQLINNDQILLYLFFKSFHYSYSIAIWALSGLAMSAVFTNTFVAVCAPLIFSYIIEMITIEPVFLPDLWHLSLSYTDISNNPWIASGYIILMFSTMGLIFSWIFYYFSKRRIENEIY